MVVFASPGSVAFSICGFDIYYYGILMAIGICCSLFLANKIANKYYGYNNLILDVAPIILIFGILGARIYYCLLNYSYFCSHPLEVLAFRYGGLSIHGALLGGAIAVLCIAKKYDKKISEICDIFAYTLPLGQSIARWGNFFNSEAFGYPTNLPWKLFIPVQNRPDHFITNSYYHPTFLYESILDFLIFLVMIYMLKKHRNFSSGIVAIVYLLLYSIARIIVEYFRIDCVMTYFNIPFPTIVSLVLIIFCLFYLAKKLR